MIEKIATIAKKFGKVVIGLGCTCNIFHPLTEKGGRKVNKPNLLTIRASYLQIKHRDK